MELYIFWIESCYMIKQNRINTHGQYFYKVAFVYECIVLNIDLYCRAALAHASRRLPEDYTRGHCRS